jgi:hypothetical protein
MENRMTCINVILKSKSAVVVTDGTALDQEGIIHSFGTKIFPLAHIDAVIVVRGHRSLVPFLGAVLGTIASSFDELKLRIVSASQELMATLPPELFGCFTDFDVIAAGISSTGPAAFAVKIYSHGPATPWEVFEIPESITLPWTSDMEKDFWRRCSGYKGVEDFNESIAIELLQSQRQPVEHIETDGFHPCVGGFVHWTEVTRDSIQMKIIHRWPADKLGQRIGQVPLPVT